LARAMNLKLPKGVLGLHNWVRNPIGATVQVLPPLHGLHRVGSGSWSCSGSPDLLPPHTRSGGGPSGSSRPCFSLRRSWTTWVLRMTNYLNCSASILPHFRGGDFRSTGKGGVVHPHSEEFLPSSTLRILTAKFTGCHYLKT